METYETPSPIFANIEAGIGDVRLSASNRSNTTASVKPSNPNRRADIEAAEATTIDFSNGYLYIKTPKTWWAYPFFKSRGSVEISVELPSGSALKIEQGMGNFFGEGAYGTCTIASGMGGIHIDEVVSLQAKSGHGEVSVQTVKDDAHLITGSGTIMVGMVGGNLDVHSGNGKVVVGTIAGEADLKTGNGAITIAQSAGSVSAKSGNGKIGIESVHKGQVKLVAGSGSIDIGIGEKTRAWLDVHTGFGTINSSVLPKEGAEESFEKAEITARTGYGDINLYTSPSK